MSSLLGFYPCYYITSDFMTFLYCKARKNTILRRPCSRRGAAEACPVVAEVFWLLHPDNLLLTMLVVAVAAGVFHHL